MRNDSAIRDEAHAWPAGVERATSRALGLYPGEAFRLVDGRCPDCATIRQALWCFADDVVAVPGPGERIAGFGRGVTAYQDLRAWMSAPPADLLAERPPLVWLGSSLVVDGARLHADGAAVETHGARFPLAWVPKIPLNRSYLDASSIEYLGARPLRLRGEWVGGRFVARTAWPADWRLPVACDPGQQAARASRVQPAAFGSTTVEAPAVEPDVSEASAVAPAALEPTPARLRALVRHTPDGGARQPFAAIRLTARDPGGAIAGKPVVALMLNGSQGDDDEAHGGHFALVTGRVGPAGEIADWMVANFYSLDVFSEKGIVAGLTPLDNYQGDLNSGQSWYRPSYLLVAVLNDERPAAFTQAALNRVYNQFYRKQLVYEHATMNCTSISVDVLRGLGWEVPARGPLSWAFALVALPYVALTERSLQKGRVAFDYFTEDQTRLFPAAAFEEIGAELLRLAGPRGRHADSPAEALLRRSIESVWFLRLPQIPSSRVFGSWPIANAREYHRRVPSDRAQRQIVPVPPRPWPEALRDPDLLPAPRTRGQVALRVYAAVILGVLCGLLWWQCGSEWIAGTLR